MEEFKFIASSDIHIKNRRPKKRIDNFVLTQKRKLAWLFKTAREHNAHILCGGDVFDSPTIAYKTVREYILLAKKYDVKFLSVFGQHDLRYHSYTSHQNTPLSVFLAGIDTTHVDEQPFENDIVCVQGASWEKEWPFPRPGKVNILLTHRLVTEKGGLWPGHTGYFEAESLIKATGYDIVVSGDNHQSFALEKDGKFLFNSGSLMRLSSAQSDFRPRVPLVTVNKKGISYEWLYIPIKKKSVVFAKDNETEQLDNDGALVKIQDFVDALSDYKVDKPNFMLNLQAVAKKLDKPTSAMLQRMIKNAIKNDSKVSVSDFVDITK